MTIFFTILPAKSGEAFLLSEVAMRSKASLGHPSHWLELWRIELEVTEGDIKKESIFKAVDEQGQIMGFYRLSGRGEKLTLSGFWVLPDQMHQGVGSALYQHMLKRAKELKTSSIEWESDPQAAPFYLKMGAKEIGKRVYLIEGHERILPIFQVQF